MAQIPPHVLNPDTPLDANLALINDNFNKVVQNTADLGANLTSTTLLTFNVNATSTAAQTVAVISQGMTTNAAFSVTTPQPVGSISSLAPQIDLYVTTDNSAAKLWPGGASSTLTSGELNFFISITAASTSFTNALTAFTIQINNRDASPHTYFVHAKAGYLPGAPTGVFR